MRYKIYRAFIYFAFAKAILTITGCNDKSQIEQEIAQIPVQTELKLFHQEFARASPDDLPRLKEDYPLLFPQRFPDSLWKAKMIGTDTIHEILEDAIELKAFNYAKIKTDVEDVIRHVKYYFPEVNEPDIITVISDVDYRHKINISQKQLFIAIDTYLGKDHELYAGINDYQKEHLDINALPADVALAYAQLFVEPSMDRTLLGTMVYHGKLHYLQELFAPAATGAQRFNYAPDKYDFTVQNELDMWRYFVDQDILYSTESRLQSRFILPAPFSKFYLDVDQETPGGIGRYIGYRIVKSFMENNEGMTIDAMLLMPADQLFNKSRYKPLQ